MTHTAWKLRDEEGKGVNELASTYTYSLSRAHTLAQDAIFFRRALCLHIRYTHAAVAASPIFIVHHAYLYIYIPIRIRCLFSQWLTPKQAKVSIVEWLGRARMRCVGVYKWDDDERWLIAMNFWPSASLLWSSERESARSWLFYG